VSGLDRREVEEYLDNLERQIRDLGGSLGPMPTWVSDQVRAMVASKLPVVDASHLLAFFAGMFTTNSAAFIYGGINASPGLLGYLGAIAYTARAVGPLFDAEPREWVAEFVDWDELLRRLQPPGGE
jgi:hypothetical protein